MKTKSSEMKISQLLPSMKETIGDMDSNFGYSSEKLANYFNEKYPFEYLDFCVLEPDDVTEDLILSRVTQLLMTFESFKYGVKVLYKGFFTPDELSFLFQYYNGSGLNSDLISPLVSQNEFLSDFDDYGKSDFSDNPDEQNQFHDKVLSMGTFEFYVLRFMIDEYWNHLQSPLNHNRLLEELMGGEPEEE